MKKSNKEIISCIFSPCNGIHIISSTCNKHEGCQRCNQ